MGPTTFDVYHLTLCVIVAILACVTSCADVAVPSLGTPDLHPYAHHLTRRDISPFTHVNLQYPDPEKFSSRLEIFLTDSSTTWLDVRWRLQNSTGVGSGETEFSRVRCYHGNLVLLSNNMNSSVNRFRFSHLTPDTEYMVYVEVLERVPGNSGDTLLHSQGTYFRTAPRIRSDSILGVILALGYLVGMGAIGYARWWWRKRKQRANHKEENDEYELSCRTSTVRFSGIEEHVHLNSSPTAEENET
nr:hypothetical protein BaRGS_033502 [Batillaria attramentaria]